MKIAVTGASGQYGGLAVEGLLGRMPAQDLILISRTPDKLANFVARGADCRFGDFDAPESLRRAFDGADRLLLISGTRVGQRISQHRAAIEAAEACKVRRLVYTSFIGVHPDNPAAIMRDHGATEEMLHASKLEWTILRDAQYSEAVTDVIAPNVLRSGEWRSSTGDGRIAFVARQDCVDCALAVLRSEGHAGKTYNITGPDLLTYREAARMVSQAAGQRINYVPVDDDGLYAMFDAIGVPRKPIDGFVASGVPWNSDDMVSFERAVRERWFEIISDDVETLLGRKPRSLRDLLVERFSKSNAEV